jgi:hypothetical protein
MKIRILLSFDHELPLGSLRTNYARALFDPTQKLFDLSSQLGVPVTLFTDVLCAKRYREWDKENFYDPYLRQIQNAVALGHDVQLHLHPHWLTSRFENGRVLPSADYSLADFIQHPEFPVSRIVKMGTDFLRDECRKSDPAFEVLAFRAGGYNIEPASAEIFTALAENGIRYDSSVVPGYYFVSALSLIDFRKLPALPGWHIGHNGDFRKGAGSGLFEIPIASIPKTPFEIPTRFKLKKYAHRAPENHGSMLHEGKPGTRMERLRMLFSSRMLTFDNHTLSADYLMRILDYNVRKYAGSGILNLATCSHPKTMGDYSFRLMEEFIGKARLRYPDIEFTTFTGLHRQNAVR